MLRDGLCNPVGGGGINIRGGLHSNFLGSIRFFQVPYQRGEVQRNRPINRIISS